MNNKGLLLSALCVLLFLSKSVSADETNTLYLGVQYAAIKHTNVNSLDYSLPALIVRTGYNFNSHFSIEGRLGTGIDSDVNDASFLESTLRIKSLMGVYGVGHLPVAKQVDVYGVIGLLQISTKDEPYSAGSEDRTGLSYGVGLNYDVGKNISLNLEYVNYLSYGDPGGYTGLAIGANYQF